MPSAAWTEPQRGARYEPLQTMVVAAKTAKKPGFRRPNRFYMAPSPGWRCAGGQLTNFEVTDLDAEVYDFCVSLVLMF